MTARSTPPGMACDDKAGRLYAEDDGVRYDRREHDIPGGLNLPPSDYVEEDWFLVFADGHSIRHNGNRFAMWLAKFIHGGVMIYCEVDRDGDPIFPGKLKP